MRSSQTPTMRPSMTPSAGVHCADRTRVGPGVRVLVQRIKCRAAFGRGRHQNPAPFRFNQRQRLARRQRDALDQRKARLRALAGHATSPAATPPIHPRACRDHPLFQLLRPAFHLLCLPFCCFSSSLAYASRVTRTANRVSTTSNSLHANCTSPAARGRSSPWFHCVSITCPGASASNWRTRNSRTGMVTPSSTGNCGIGALKTGACLA